MTDKEPIAPSLEDLSHAQVESSKLFGFTNISGKALSLISLTTLVGGGAGIAQGLGFLGPVMGLTMTLTAGFVALGTSVATGLVGYWLGNFDDKRIKAHNSRAAQAFQSARGSMYDKIERGFMQALSKVEYDPGENSLPYDALGHAVLLKDEKIEKLPDHVRMDIYRTQLDLELYKARQLTSHTTVQGKRFEEKTLGLPTTAEKATAYKNCRDSVRRAIQNGTLSITAITEKKQDRIEENDRDDSEIDSADVILDAIEAFSRTSRGMPRSGGGGFRSGAGGDFGGGGASGSWTSAALSAKNNASGPVPMVIVGDAGASGSSGSNAGFGWDAGSSGSSGGSSSGGSSFDLGDIDGEAAGPLLIVAGAAAVVAASAVAGFSLWKNFISAAEKPALGDVHLPMISKSLASAEKDVRKMYTPV